MSDRGRTVLLAAALGLVAAATVTLCWLDTLVDWVRQPGRGAQIELMRNANLVVAPLALIAFALGFGFLRDRRFGLAALALPAFPAWCMVLLLADTWLVNMGMGMAAVAGFSGFAPFGPGR